MADDLSVISVVYREPEFWKRNVALTRRLNPGASFHWFVVDNSDPSVLNQKCASDVTVVEGQAKRAANDSGSLHHAMGIQSSLGYVKTRYLLILDHDFFILLPNWIDALITHVREQGLTFFGAPWHPRWYYQYRGFPSVHCMLIDLHRAPLDTLDFTPAIEDDRWWHFINQPRRFLPDPLRERFKVQRIRDTGWKIFKGYGKTGEAKTDMLTPFYRLPPTRDVFIDRLVDRFVPERWQKYPHGQETTANRSFIAPLCTAAVENGWEEFYWCDKPFGFHLRRVGRTFMHDKTDDDLTLLSKVLECHAAADREFEQ